MKILTIFTGGTIGCSPVDKTGILSVSTDAYKKNWEDYYLIKYFKENSASKNRGVSFDTIEPLRILSENIIVESWEKLIFTLSSIDFTVYKGIIITHGSDTLAYSASLFGFLLSGCGVPVVFTAANYNLFDKRTNGHRNFEDAVDFICNYNYSGVFVIFGYEKHNSEVYIGTRIKQPPSFTDKYESISGINFGFIENGIFIKTPDNTCTDISNLKKDSSLLLYKIKKLNKRVMLIKPYIGLNYDWINLDHKEISAVLHETFHSFTACVNEDLSHSFSIVNFSRKCSDKNLPLYAAPFNDILLSDNTERYDSIDKMLTAGIKPICNMSLESAYTKLLLAVNLHLDDNERADFLKTSIFYENI